MTSSCPPPARSRWPLLLLCLLFLGPALLAGALYLSGWKPVGSRQHGELLDPPVDLRALPARHPDGRPLDWLAGERHWRVLVAPEPGCGTECVDLSQDLAKVWQLLGHTADNVEILWLGSAPAGHVLPTGLQPMAPSPALRAALPGLPDPAGTPVHVVDPNGFVILRYAPGFDPAGLRADLAKLLKLK